MGGVFWVSDGKGICKGREGFRPGGRVMGGPQEGATARTKQDEWSDVKGWRLALATVGVPKGLRE